MLLRTFYVLFTVHPELRVKRNQLDAQLILSIFRQPLNVSGVSRPITKRHNRTYTTIGTYYSFYMTVVLVGLEIVLFTRNSGCGTNRSGSLTGIPLSVDYRLGKATRHLTRPELRKNMCQIPVYSFTTKQSCLGYYIRNPLRNEIHVPNRNFDTFSTYLTVTITSLLYRVQSVNAE